MKLDQLSDKLTESGWVVFQSPPAWDRVFHLQGSPFVCSITSAQSPDGLLQASLLIHGGSAFAQAKIRKDAREEEADVRAWMETRAWGKATVADVLGITRPRVDNALYAYATGARAALMAKILRGE